VRLGPPRGIPAVDDGERQVHQDQIGPVELGLGHALFAVHGGDHVVAVLEELDEEVTLQRGVLHHENTLSRRRHACSSIAARSLAYAIGTLTVNVDPRPTALSTVMSPPRRRARWRLMDRPRPVPPRCPAGSLG